MPSSIAMSSAAHSRGGNAYIYTVGHKNPGVLTLKPIPGVGGDRGLRLLLRALSPQGVGSQRCSVEFAAPGVARLLREARPVPRAGEVLVAARMSG